MILSRRLTKLISFFLSFIMLFQSFAPALVYAADEISSSSATPVNIPVTTPTETPTPSPELTPTTVPVADVTASITATVTPTVSPTESPTPTLSPTELPTVSLTPTETPTPTPDATLTPQLTPTPTPEATPSATITPPLSSSGATPITTSTPSPTSTVAPTPSEANPPLAETPTSPLASSGATPTPDILDTGVTTIQEPAVILTSSATLITDKLDYSPNDTVNITGSNFTPFQSYIVVVSSEDNPAVSWPGIIFADGSGSFNYSVKLDGNYRPNYKVEVKTDAGVLIATTTFTDSISYDFQSFNKNSLSYGNGNPCGGGSSCYAEGENVLFQLIISGLTIGNTYSLPINHDYQNSSSVVGYSDFNSLSAVSSSADTLSLGSPTTSAGLPNTRTYTVGFRAQSATVTLQWNGLLGNQAAQFCGGACLQARLVSGVNGENVGNQTISLNPNDIIILGSITPTKSSANGADPTQWTFNISGNTDVSNVLSGSSAQDLALGANNGDATYTITENGPTGWVIDTVSSPCTKSSDLSATVVLSSESPDISCTFTNKQLTGTIIIVKDSQPNDAQDFQFLMTGDVIPDGFVLDDDLEGPWFNTISLAKSPGPYTVTESSTTGWSLADVTCVDPTDNSTSGLPSAATANIDLAAGETVTCTFTNTRNTGSLQVIKNVDLNGDGDYTDEGEAGATDWSFDITSGEQNIATGQTRTLNTGSYTISEDGKTDYHLVGWACSDGTSGSTNSIPATISADTTLTCTFSNARDTGTITVHKDVLDPDDNAVVDTTIFHTLLDGGNSKDVSDGGSVTYSNVTTGSYTISEDTLPTGYTQVSITDNGSVAVSTGTTSEIYIVNKQVAATLTVAKVVKDPDGNVITNDTTHFTANVGNQSLSIYQGHDAVFNLNPSTYTVTESTNTDYTQLGCKLPTGEDATNFTLTPAQALTVTCTNQQKPATITVYKNVLAADGSTDVSDTHGFNVTLNSETKPFSEGSPAVYTVNPATYTAIEDSLVGTDYTFVSNTGSVSVGSNGSASITIVNKQNPGLISGYKYDATTGLGIFGWTINLSGDATASTTTNSTGFYQFLGLNVGTYTVTEDQPTGWTPTTSTSYNVSINPGTESTGNNFTNFHNISITACKQIDNDGDLTTTNDQTNKSGWGMTLSNGTTTDTKSTGEDGCYTWNDKGPGSYSLSEETPTGWTNLTATSYNFGVAESGVNLSHTFVNFDNGHISGHKFNDQDGDGLWDNSESALSNWVISAVYPDLSVHTRTTNSIGYYNFGDLGPGTYTLTEINQSNWTQTSPTSGEYVISMTSNGDFDDNDFGNRGLGTITVHKEIIGTSTDLTQFCFTLSPDPVGQVCANESGDAVFNNVPSGSYTASESATVANYTQSATTCDQTMTINNGGDSASCTVTNTRDQGTINFEKIVDDQSDVANWSFTIDGVDGTLYSDDQVTLDTGTYSVTESGPDGYTPFSVDDVICTNLDGESADISVTTQGGICTFTNHVDRGSITVTKITNPDTAEDSFDFSLTSGDTNDEASLANGKTHTFTDLFPGNYSLTESHDGWDLESVCYDEEENEISADDIDLNPGQTISCTFTNTKHGSITITKDAQPDSDQEFSFETKLIDGSFTLVDNDGESQNSRQFSDLSAGQYIFTEEETSGWDLDSIICDGTESYSVEGRQLVVNLQPGETPTCTFTNSAVEPRLTLTKSNNAASDKTPGDSVTFTLTLTVSGNGVTNPKVVDLPAKGFKYRAGSWYVTINGLPVTIAEPTYHSPGTWSLPTLAADDIVIMTYIADIDNGQTPGLYKDLAWAKGNSTSGTVLAEGSDGAFTGSEVTVVKSTQDTPTVNVENKVEGQVLGVTTLPATGADVRWLYLALTLGLVGLATTSTGLILRKKHD